MEQLLSHQKHFRLVYQVYILTLPLRLHVRMVTNYVENRSASAVRNVYGAIPIEYVSVSCINLFPQLISVPTMNNLTLQLKLRQFHQK